MIRARLTQDELEELQATYTRKKYDASECNNYMGAQLYKHWEDLIELLLDRYDVPNIGLCDGCIHNTNDSVETYDFCGNCSRNKHTQDYFEPEEK